mgnify:CR=1 FL=1
MVHAYETISINRIKQRDHRSINEIRAIINSQVSDEKRLNEADDIIENNENLASLEAQIKRLDEIYTNAATG